ncbi:MAG: trehalose-6-phosphate synthase [Acidobacteria bacterium]|nr:trehalose-6-phosphate synthase [Acidobacteriota bacterium]
MVRHDNIKQFIRSTLARTRFVVVSNREPYIHTYSKTGEIQCNQPTSGLVSALDPVLQAARGIWIAHATGEADAAVADRNGIVSVPPDSPRYLLKRVWMTPEQEQGYYSGFSNQALWPLCHAAYTRPHFDRKHWQAYQQVNELFAETVRQAVGQSRALVFVQDYHFALLPRLIKQHCPNAIVAHFWHIPWPSLEVLRICPWQREIVWGLLGSDLLGFHLPQYCRNFIAGARALFPQVRTAPGNSLHHQERLTKVRPFPIGIDFEQFDSLSGSEAVERQMQEFRRRYRLPLRIGIGIDRLDYIKGIPARLRAVDRFLEAFPQYRGQFSFVQVAVPSRCDLAPYQELRRTVCDLVKEINRKYQTRGWKPIVLIPHNLSLLEVTALYRLADFCLVTSLQDGMNLVAQEFVASRSDGQGALLLSRFAGAAEFLRDAFLVNPYDIDEIAHHIAHALQVEPSEKRRRMRRMRSRVRRRNIFRWTVDVLAAAAECGVAPLGSEEEAVSTSADL